MPDCFAFLLKLIRPDVSSLFCSSFFSSSSRSRLRERCTPRLDAAREWISSTITQRTRLQLLPKAGRAEKDGQGLGSGVEDVRSPLQHAGLFLGGDVPVPDGVPDLLHLQPPLLCQGLHLLQGPLQVFVNIVGQRFERRDVEAVDPVFQLASFQP